MRWPRKLRLRLRSTFLRSRVEQDLDDEGRTGAGRRAGVYRVEFDRSCLYGVAPQDPLTLSLATMLLVVVALGAAYLPAHRAAKLDPMAALRQ